VGPYSSRARRPRAHRGTLSVDEGPGRLPPRFDLHGLERLDVHHVAHRTARAMPASAVAPGGLAADDHKAALRVERGRLAEKRIGG
jgi:hypothetical protein